MEHDGTIRFRRKVVVVVVVVVSQLSLKSKEIGRPVVDFFLVPHWEVFFRSHDFITIYSIPSIRHISIRFNSIVRLPKVSPEPARASQASVSTLPSGLVVVTEDACSTSTVTMTYPKAGSASESIDEAGAALINKCMAFQSGSGLSTTLVNRTIENEGAMPFAKADRTGATLGYTVEPDNALGLVPLLALDCTYEKWDIRDAKKLAKFQVDEANKSVEVVLTEQIYAAAYGASSSMGRPFYSAAASPIEISSFRNKGYGINGAILTATGIQDHAAFCAEVDSLLSEAPKGDSSTALAATYLGGEARLSAPSTGYAHVALAFEVASIAGPVKNILKHCYGLVGKDTGASTFATGGMVGVYASAPSGAVGSIDAIISNTMTAQLTADVIAKAKVLAKAEATFDLDCGSTGLASAMTAAVMETGSFTDAASVAEAYDAVSDSDITKAASLMLASNPALAAVGDISVVPYQGSFASRF
jgi:predicted Zn-dependent peptidase